MDFILMVKIVKNAHKIVYYVLQQNVQNVNQNTFKMVNNVKNVWIIVMFVIH